MFDSNPKKGLGSFGRPTENGAVVDGAFAGLQLSYPVPHTLRREYTPYPHESFQTEAMQVNQF
jgi:tyrosinase